VNPRGFGADLSSVEKRIYEYYVDGGAISMVCVGGVWQKKEKKNVAIDIESTLYGLGCSFVIVDECSPILQHALNSLDELDPTIRVDRDSGEAVSIHRTPAAVAEFRRRRKLELDRKRKLDHGVVRTGGA